VLRLRRRPVLMMAESPVSVRLYFDAGRLVVAPVAFVGPDTWMLGHRVFERPVSDEVLVEAVTVALAVDVPDEFEGTDVVSWGPVLDLFGVSGLERLACCHVRSQGGYVWVTAMKPGDDGFPVVAARGDGGSARVGDGVWLAYELRRGLETSLNTAGERFGARGGLAEVAEVNGDERSRRMLVGAAPSSIVEPESAAGPLRFELGAAVAGLASSEVDDDAFNGLLDELAAAGLWDSLDEAETQLSHESNLKRRSWRWAQLDDSVRVDLDLDSMLVDDLERSLVGRVRDRWARAGLHLVVEHGSGTDHQDMSFQGFRVWINREPVSYGPTIETIFRPLVLMNWLADRAGIDERMYLSGVFNGWHADSPGFDYESAYFLSRPVAELIQGTPLLGASQKLVAVETLSGRVNEWTVR